MALQHSAKGAPSISARKQRILVLLLNATGTRVAAAKNGGIAVDTLPPAPLSASVEGKLGVRRCFWLKHSLTWSAIATVSPAGSLPALRKYTGILTRPRPVLPGWGNSPDQKNPFQSPGKRLHAARNKSICPSKWRQALHIIMCIRTARRSTQPS